MSTATYYVCLLEGYLPGLNIRSYSRDQYCHVKEKIKAAIVCESQEGAQRLEYFLQDQEQPQNFFH